MINYQYAIDYFNEFPMLVQIAWAMSGVLFLAIIILAIYLKSIRYFLRNRAKDLSELKNQYEELLVKYLYSGEEDGEISTVQLAIINKLKIAITDTFKRKIVVSILYNLMNEVSGEMSGSIKTLYFKTNLFDHALIKLRSKNWYEVAKSIGELNRFKIDEAHDEIVKFIKHPRREVRRETRLYLVNLFRFEGLTFLNDFKTPLSEWDQVKLLEILQKFDDQQICDIKPWLRSNNNTVVLFALKLAEIYNQFEVKDVLIELLLHVEKSIRVRVIEVLTSLYGIEAKEMLKANFNELSMEEQLSFFGMLEKLVIPSDEPFIEAHLFHKNFEVQLLALKILKSINIDKFMGLNNLPVHEKSSAMLKLQNAI